MVDDSHVKISSRPHYGEPNKCEKGIRFPTKKCIICNSFDECRINSLLIHAKYNQAREDRRDERTK